ncbi:PQQ-binding-like beta-propeller repeat protein [Mucilaginibacter sp. UR6-11]|uniref:outer membrane protein assembly factor BamB family protein n=1 Tax=Mucilaginibacter sp. UR6-11 TaxID=1435644 RepID=UPI001E35AA20|nr:PQQ-binding-like beta-propeller repeat protein [Mucilaginibacter sp. UR6-11]MCC8424588.1 PQQ-binding-like beta-propeller repeat protein [Mucilaginibacter sp. UR6-11]
MRKTFWITGLLVLALIEAKAQEKPWQFAHISDTHIGNETSIEDLQRTIKDINANSVLDFVVITGDITEFGSDEELKTAREMFNSLNKPWYIIPGNHDMKWSESGGNSFKKVFGSETVAFKHNGFLFLGTNCGPNMRMSPGQVPRENIVWLDSVLKQTPAQTPVIFMNHYPQDSSLNNWYEIIDRLKTHNTQLVICGHGHSNQHLNFEGIPGVMGRSNLRAKDTIGGYNIVTIKGDSVFYNERLPGVMTKPTWTKDRLYQHDFTKDNYPRPSYAVNKQFGDLKQVWTLQDDNDIGAGTTIIGNMVIVTNTGGWIKAYAVNSGKKIWATKTGGKLYSTPCASGNAIVVACADNFLYCLQKNTGKVNWKAAAEKPLVTSPVIADGRVFCGGSDGHFRCFELSSGKLNWDFNQVKGFVETRPLLYNGRIYFGSWGNHFYVLDQKSGSLIWSWSDGYTNRMFSPAACNPVATGNRVFIVAPDRYMTCFDASGGKVIWRNGDPKIRVRESMGLSADSSLVFVKTMDGDILGIDTRSDNMDVKWKAGRNIGYDISPSMVEEHDGLVFALSDSGSIYSFKRNDGSLVWIHKLTNCLVNPLGFSNDHKLIATTMDGNISCLKY